jgi:hypothetical protein
MADSAIGIHARKPFVAARGYDPVGVRVAATRDKTEKLGRKLNKIVMRHRNLIVRHLLSRSRWPIN